MWHSLNENGDIGVYDMKFGDTIIRNLTESDIEEGHKASHKRDSEEEHGAQDEDDPKRKNEEKK